MKKFAFAITALLASSGAAMAQYTSDFEAPLYSASPAGVDLTPLPSPGLGQDNWYQPVAANSLNYMCYEYAGGANALGIPVNPTGGLQFVAGRNTGGTFNTRTQHGFAWGAGTEYIVEWDIAFNYGGVIPATDNVGSFSLQPSATAKFWQTLYRFEDVATAANVKAEYNVYNAAGVSTPNMNPGISASSPWRNLKMNNWYRQRTVFDFATNQITEVGIQDITGGGAMLTVKPAGWYLTGGAAPTLPMPSDLRFFSGGTTAGNTVAWDNLSVKPVAEVCYADCDGDNVLSIDDFICFQTMFAIGC